MGGGLCPQSHFKYSFSVSDLFESPKLPIVNQWKDFTIFFSGCFNVTASLFIRKIVLVKECSVSLGSIYSQRPAFLSLKCSQCPRFTGIQNL